jgi:hypothetical protein
MRLETFRSTAILAALITMTSAARQRPSQLSAPATASISGVVVDGATAAPIAGAVVSLGIEGARGPLPDRRLTDSEGRFVFMNLPPARGYSVRASGAGYFDGGLGAPALATADDGPIALADGESFTSARVRLWRPGAISGTVTNEKGDPVVGVFVRAIAILRVVGRSLLASASIALTDDRGAYRIASLPPGRYYIAVPNVERVAALGATISRNAGQLPSAPSGSSGHFPVPPPSGDGRAMTYPLTFYPNVPAVAQATGIDLAYGQERPQIDIHLAPVATGRITGTVDGPFDPAVPTLVRLLPPGLEDLGNGSEVATTLVKPDRTFVLPSVPPGTYSVDVPITLDEFQVSAPNSTNDLALPTHPGLAVAWSAQSLPGAPTGSSFTTGAYRGTALTPSHYRERGTVTVRASEDAPVALMMHAGVKVNGRFVFEYDPKQPKPATKPRFLVWVDPVSGQPGYGRAGEMMGPEGVDRGFELKDLLKGLYFLRVTASPDQWTIKSINAAGHEMRDVPLDTRSSADVEGLTITITNALASLTGTVHDVKGLLATSAVVVAFPADRSAWTDYGLSPARIKAAYVESDGIYRLLTLPAGDYDVAAVAGARIDAWQQPGFFEAADALAAHVTLAWGEKRTLDLKTAEIRR